MPRFALLLTTFIWGATFPATKAVLAYVPPIGFLFFRFFLGVLLVGIGFWLWRLRLHRDTGLLWASALATSWLFLGYVFQTVGLRYTTASNSAFITALYVVIVPLVLCRFDRRVWVATGLAIVGLWLLIKPSASMNPGNFLTFAGAVAFAGHIVCLERFTREFNAPSLFAWQMVAMVVLLFPAMLIEQALVPVPLLAFAPTSILLIGFGVTGGLATGAFAVQVWAQRILPAQQVALIFASEPVYAAWLSWYFLGETLDLQGWGGSALILIGVMVGAWGSESSHTPSSVVPKESI